MDWTIEVAADIKIVEGDKSQLSEYIEYDFTNSMWITNKGRQVIKVIKVNLIAFDLFYIDWIATASDVGESCHLCWDLTSSDTSCIKSVGNYLRVDSENISC